MSWDLSFVGALNSSSLSVDYKLEFLGVLNSLGRPIVLYSGKGDLQIAKGSIRIQCTSVIPQRWSVSLGGFSLQLSGDIRHILPNIRKGQLALLKCSLNSGGYYTVASGQLRSLQGFRGLYTLGFVDLFTAFQNSLDTRAGTILSDNDPPKFSLFYEVGQETTNTIELGLSDTTLTVEDASFFKKSGGKGIVLCTVGSDEFYLFWTSSTSTTLTVESCTYKNKERKVLTVGSTVRYCAWLEGEPHEIIASILTSTGNSTNGEFDVYPVEWGIGGRLNHNIFDLQDAKIHSNNLKRSDDGDYKVGIAIETPLQDGFSYILNIFAIVGIFPVYRQGKITLRSCTDPEGIETRRTPLIRGHIHDIEIISILSHEFFNSDISTIYRTTTVQYSEGDSYSSGGVYNNSRVDCLPATKQITRVFSDFYLTTSTAKKESALNDLRRLRVWDLYISEKIAIRVPLIYSGLVAGDVVTIRSELLEHLYDNIDPVKIGRYCMVLSNSFSIDAQECILVLGVPSPKASRSIDSEQLKTAAYSGWKPDDDWNNNQLIVWLRVEDGLSVDSSNDVTSWVDKMNSFSFTTQGGVNNTSSGNKPSKTQTAGGQEFIRFDHTNHEFLSARHNIKMNLSSTNGVTIVAFIRKNSANTAIGDADYSGASYKKLPIINHGRSYRLQALDDSPYNMAVQFENGSSSVNDDNNFKTDFTIIIWTSSAVSGYTGEQGLYVNGTKEITSTYVPTNTDESTSPDMRLSRDEDITYGDPTTQYNYAFGSMDLIEIQVFNTCVHDNEREKIEGYLAWKYNYTSLLPSSHPYKTTQPT